MKLIICRICADIVALRQWKRRCNCKRSGGNYENDGLHAYIFGPCVPLGIDNTSLLDAVREQPEQGLGKKFSAFVIPKVCDTVKRTL